MSTDALNPAVPTGANQVELTSELRGIKVRLVADKSAIETLQTDIEPVTGAGATGLQILADSTPDEVLADLSVTAIGKNLIQGFADIEALQEYLGIHSNTVEVVTVTGSKGTIAFPGGVQFKWSVDLVPGGGGSFPFLWNSPFTTVVFGGGVNSYAPDGPAWYDTPPTVTGGKCDHDNNGATTLFSWAIGL